MAHQRWAKRKGTIAERDLISLFWDSDWSAHRIAGSGSSRYPSPDIIAGTPLRKLAIEVKMTKDTRKYFTAEEIGGLKFFCDIFGSEAWVAVKFGKEPWYFFSLEDLKETGKNFAVSISDIPTKGFSFDELIK